MRNIGEYAWTLGAGDMIPDSILSGGDMMRRFLLCAFLSLWTVSGAWGGGVPSRSFDVVVVGGGAGGCAAAIRAARLGMRVAILEESDWIGGQMTGAAVSTMDDVGRTRTGIYREFTERVRARYAAIGRSVSTCYWGPDTIAFEPAAGQDVLRSMIREIPAPGSVTIETETRVTQARREGKRLVAVTAVRDFRPTEYRAAVFVDATECGDLLPLAGARYRAGNSVSPDIDMDANIQDITYVAVIRKYESPSAADATAAAAPPPGYDAMLPNFRKVVTRDGNRRPGKYPFDVVSHNAYRGLPDPGNPLPADSGTPSTWPNITKTGVNWANDWPGRGGEVPGLTVRYLEDRLFRKLADREALLKTLGFLLYFRSELGQTDWSADDSQGYSGRSTTAWDVWPVTKDAFAAALRHIPPFPYVRESRRLVGLDTLRNADIVRADGRALKNYPTAMALGEYPVDIHGAHLDRFMEHDLGESAASFPSGWEPSRGVFQLPFGVFVPETVDGLLAAEKNISVSRLVNGAIRLQPAVMLAGQAVGTIAACAVRKGCEVRDVAPMDVQLRLLDAGSRLSMETFADVPEGGAEWKAVQFATLYELLPGMTRDLYAPSLPMTGRQTRVFAERLAGAFPKRFRTPGRTADFASFPDVGSFRALLARLAIPEGRDIPLPDGVRDADALTRGGAVRILLNALR